MPPKLPLPHNKGRTFFLSFKLAPMVQLSGTTSRAVVFASRHLDDSPVRLGSKATAAIVGARLG